MWHIGYKKPDLKEYILYDFISMKSKSRQNYIRSDRNQKVIPEACQGVGMGRN